MLDFGAQAWEEYGGLFGGEEVETGRVSFEYGLSNKELAKFTDQILALCEKYGRKL